LAHALHELTSKGVNMTKFFLLFFLLFSSISNAFDENSLAIEKAKSADVHQLDASLPSEKFQVWLRSLVGDRTIVWEISDCGEQSGNPEADKGRDFPLCVEVTVVLSEKRTLFVNLALGTFGTGISKDPAQFSFAVIREPNGSQTWIHMLSQLPAAVKSR
jgi:hypothetical protein